MAPKPAANVRRTTGPGREPFEVVVAADVPETPRKEGQYAPLRLSFAFFLTYAVNLKRIPGLRRPGRSFQGHLRVFPWSVASHVRAALCLPAASLCCATVRQQRLQGRADIGDASCQAMQASHQRPQSRHGTASWRLRRFKQPFAEALFTSKAACALSAPMSQTPFTLSSTPLREKQLQAQSCA